MKILHVLHLNPFKSVGGSEIYVYNLAKHLSKNHEQFIFCCDPTPKLKNLLATKFMETGQQDGLPFIAVKRPSILTLTGFENKILVENSFRRTLENFKPDIIHYHHLSNLSLNLPRISSSLKIPSVFTIHDSSLICPQFKLIDDDFNICKKITGKCIICCLKARYKDDFFYNSYFRLKNIWQVINKNKTQEIFNNINLFISPSLFLRNKFIENGLSPDKIIHIPFGLENNFTNEEKVFFKNNLRFGFIGKISETKGIKVLIKAFNEIKNVSLDIYGKAEDDKALEDYKKMVTNKNINFREQISGEIKKEALKNMDVLIVPSVIPETAYFVIAEAMTAKIPVITSNIGGMAELVEDKINGLHFKVGNSDDLKIKIEWLINNPEEVIKMSKNIDEPKNMDEHTKKIVGIYNEFI